MAQARRRFAAPVAAALPPRALLAAAAALACLAAAEEGSEPTLLELASAETQDIDAVWELLKGGADTGATDEGGHTALHHAARRGHVRTTKLLIEHGADADAASESARSPLCRRRRPQR